MAGKIVPDGVPTYWNVRLRGVLTPKVLRKALLLGPKVLPLVPKTETPTEEVILIVG